MSRLRGTQLAALAALLCAGALVTPADATPIQIGPGSDIAGATGVDSPGPRLNVEPAFAVSLAAGSYEVLSFSLNSADDARPDGFVRPFLAELTNSSPLTYETLWVGPRLTPDGAGIKGITYPSLSELLTLAAGTDVYAGVYQDGIAIVRFNNVATVTNHDNTPTEPTAPGQTITAFSHPTLNNRTYAYEINVDPIPKPATLSLLALGALGLLRRRRRNR